MTQEIVQAIMNHQQLVTEILHKQVDGINTVALRIVECLRTGGTVYWCGNGGSASDALHLSAELLGRFEKDRSSYASIALGSNVSALTAIGNDYGFECIFSRQIEGLGKTGDVLIGLSTSGNSENVVRAVEQARGMGITTIGMLGRDGGKLKDLCAYTIVVPDDNTARIQEMHIMIGHCICSVVENSLSGGG